MDQRMLQEKILSDPSASAAVERALLGGGDKNSQLDELLSCVDENEAGMKDALLSIPVPAHLKKKLLALPDVDETQTAPAHSEASHGLHSIKERALTFAKRFRIALIMAAVFATAAGFSLFMPGA